MSPSMPPKDRGACEMTSKLLVGQYVRCPIYFEDADKENPRQFILAKVKLINELSDVVTVDIFDMHHLRQYYEHIFKQGYVTTNS